MLADLLYLYVLESGIDDDSIRISVTKHTLFCLNISRVNFCSCFFGENYILGL